MTDHPLPQGHPPGTVVDEVGTKIAKEAATELELRTAFASGVEAMKGLTVADLVTDAAEDPCMPIRNLAGHIVTCNYGDWADFSKCKCAEGLLTSPEKQTAFVASPMPLRDIFASSIHISDDVSHDLAMGIRKAREQNQKIKTVSSVLGVGNDQPLTIVELADARAKIRYLEADAMIAWRAESLRINAEIKADAERAAKVDAAGAKAEATPICGCGHSATQHEAKDFGDSVCMLDSCMCKRYQRASPGIVATGAMVCKCGHRMNAHNQQDNNGALLGCVQCDCHGWREGVMPPGTVVTGGARG